MDGTILGVLLGITLSAVVALALIGDHRHKELAGLIQNLKDEIAKHDERIVFLEKRKALLAEAVTSQPKPAGVAGVRTRSWSENMPIGEDAR